MSGSASWEHGNKSNALEIEQKNRRNLDAWWHSWLTIPDWTANLQTSSSGVKNKYSLIHYGQVRLHAAKRNLNCSKMFLQLSKSPSRTAFGVK